MELRHLKYFLKLAEELSFVRAADKLFISQPPLSRQIKELETELGAVLFERNNKRVMLTEAGKYYQKEIQELVQNLERINRTTKKISQNQSGEFRIAYVSSTFSGDISKLIQFLSNEYPFVNFRLYEVPTVKQIAALEEGKIDFGIIRAPLHSPKIDAQLWFKDSFSLVFNRNNYSIESEEELEKLNEATFVFFNKEYAPYFYDALLQICAKYGFNPKVVHESNNISSIIQLVKNGLGISIVPTAIKKSHNYPELEFVELKKSVLFTDILLATPKGNPSEISKLAIEFLTKPTFENEN
ncbi:LysR family transcriptional regulator [Flavobacterium seoulense]|uniref:LysR family transcriptional regulator n=1 Tax=Flavobacterium seoulense TaxID=1492738 RepID=A0A066WJU9_9FLAO|nr:LysR family transcriptional regulator [Flavobacterium seoulense]KDN54131.1 LysR family transcriptional regulator [Flavobacterium seoulense]